MIDLEAIRAAYDDIIGYSADDEFELEDVKMRFEMMNIDFEDFRIFLTSRLAALDERYDFHPEFSRGYVHAAMEFFLYGNLTGKEDKLDEEIGGSDQS